MRRRNKLLYATAIAATIGTIHYLNSGPSGGAARLSRPAGVSPETLAAVAKVKTGSTRAQVEQILGLCSFAKAEPGPDGHTIESGAWLHGEDMIYVRFADGIATLVAAAPLADLGEAPSPAPGQAADASATANGEKGASQQMESFQNRLRRLEEKLKVKDHDEKVFRRALNPAAEQE